MPIMFIHEKFELARSIPSSNLDNPFGMSYDFFALRWPPQFLHLKYATK